MTGGIYQIKNVATGDSYIGSSVDLGRRRTHHLWCLRNNKHSNQRLQRAWDKYGALAFVITTLECITNAAELLSREQHWIDALSPAYNLAPVAGNNRGIKRSAETLIKMSAWQKGKPKPPHSEETKAKMSRSHLGRKHSEESRRKIGLSKRGNRYSLGKTTSASARALISAAMRGKRHALGRVVSEETREKIRQKRLAYWRDRKAMESATA